MIRIITYPILMVILFLFAHSCSENFLQPEPKSFFAPENVYLDPGGFEAQLVTLRKNLTNEIYGGRGTARIPSQWIFSEVAVGGAQMDHLYDTTPTAARDWFRINGGIEDKYRFIKDANVIISRIDNIEWQDQQHRTQILAEALWHRAYWYNRMVNSYGDVPYIGKEITSARVDFNTHRRDVILDKIQSDLENYVIGVLPEVVNPGFVSNGAANHLLTRVAMSNNDFETAIEAATRVINGPYELMRQRFGVDLDNESKNLQWDLHRPDNINSGENTETILGLVDRFSDPDDAKSTGTFHMQFYNPSWHHSRVQDSQGGQCTIAGHGGELTAGQWDTLGRGGTSAPINYFLQYHIWHQDGYTHEDTPDERRGAGNWWEVEDILCNDPNSPDYGQPAINGTIGGSPPGLIHTSLYTANVNKTYHPERTGDPLGGNADMYLFRLAETYLLRAEAYHWTGQNSLAADDINQIRERAGAEPITAGDVTIDYIFDESLRELFFETPRQNDLARVSIYMAKEGINGYSVENLHENNFAHDRILDNHDWYPNYRGEYVGTLTPHGFELPLGEQYQFASGLTPRIGAHNWIWPLPDNFIDANTQGTINQNLGYEGAHRNKPPLETIDEDVDAPIN